MLIVVTPVQNVPWFVWGKDIDTSRSRWTLFICLLVYLFKISPALMSDKQWNIPFGFIISSFYLFIYFFYCKLKDLLHLCTVARQNLCLHKMKQPTYKTCFQMQPSHKATALISARTSTRSRSKSGTETPEALPIRHTARRSVWAACRSWTHRRVLFFKSAFVLLNVWGDIGRRLVFGSGERWEFSC